MSVAFANELTAIQGPVNTAGLGGSSQQGRATSLRGHMQVSITSFTIPASGAGSVAGDIVYMAVLYPFTKIARLRLLWGSGGGASSSVFVGKVDTNNSANTDATHYLPNTSTNGAGSAESTQNMGEQVGVDTLGDQSTGNVAPQFGAAEVIVSMTLGATAPAASTKFIMIVEYQQEG